MTVGAALVRYAILVGVLGPAALCRASWPLRAPRPGAAVVLAAAARTALIVPG